MLKRTVMSLCILAALTITVAAQSATPVFTSLIIDARDLPLERSMSPKIISDKGYEVYGTIFKDLDKLFEAGVVMYAPSLSQARAFNDARVGKSPMLVKALRVEGASSADIVISDEDARKVLEENKKGNFLEKYKVIVLMGPSTKAE